VFKFIFSGFLVTSFILQGAMAQKGKLTLKPDPIFSKSVVQFLDKQTVGSLIDSLKSSLTEEDMAFLKKTYQKQSRLILSADLRGDKVFVNGEEVLTIFEDRRMDIRGRLFAYNKNLGVEENFKNLDQVLNGSKVSLVDLFLPRAHAIPPLIVGLVVVAASWGGYAMSTSKGEVKVLSEFSHVGCQGKDYVLIFQDKKNEGPEIRRVMSPIEVENDFKIPKADCDEVSMLVLTHKLGTSVNYTNRLSPGEGKTSGVIPTNPQTAPPGRGAR
jgi:hypothetical protein